MGRSPQPYFTMTDTVPPSQKPAQAQVGDVATAPTTTAESQLMTASQRDINSRWEMTQQNIAYLVTFATVVVAGFLAIRGESGDGPFLLLSNFATYIVATYFTRTNHTKTGGVQTGDTGR